VGGPSETEPGPIFLVAPTLHGDTIHLADHDEQWAEWFAQHAIRIRRALGNDALRIEHVGSTAVPGLAAKPIIDIVLVVADSSDEPSYVSALEAEGYTLRLREPAWFEHRLFKGPEGALNMHVFSAGCPEIDRMVRFRDHIRVDEADRELYERTKRELAARRWKYVQDYADAKSEVVADIAARIDKDRSPKDDYGW
jgi:GrpB-like predicted nucleotidyltransferase (UPF0157 family)